MYKAVKVEPFLPSRCTKFNGSLLLLILSVAFFSKLLLHYWAELILCFYHYKF